MTRFATLRRFLRPNHILYDLCCDHGRVGLEALAFMAKVVFVDQSEEALTAIRNTIPKLAPRFQAKTEIIQAPAEKLELPSKPCDIIIAGVGIKTTIEILDGILPGGLDGHRLILSPQRSSEALRAYLIKRNWKLLAECVVEEKGRFREIIVIEESGGEISEFGESFADQDDPVAQKFAAYLQAYYEKIRSLRDL